MNVKPRHNYPQAAELAAGDDQGSVDGDAAGGEGATSAAPKRRANFDQSGHGGHTAAAARRGSGGDSAADHAGHKHSGGKGSGGSVKGTKHGGGGGAGGGQSAGGDEGNGASVPLLRLQSSMRLSAPGNGGASGWFSALKAKILG